MPLEKRNKAQKPNTSDHNKSYCLAETSSSIWQQTLTTSKRGCFTRYSKHHQRLYGKLLDNKYNHTRNKEEKTSGDNQEAEVEAVLLSVRLMLLDACHQSLDAISSYLMPKDRLYNAVHLERGKNVIHR